MEQFELVRRIGFCLFIIGPILMVIGFGLMMWSTDLQFPTAE